MNRFYEETLPEGYQEAFVVDANDKDSYSKLTTATLLINTVLFVVIFSSFVKTGITEITGGFSVIKIVGLLAAYMIYVVLHELTHGVVYKLLTKQKLTFGFKPPVAYCGVPEIYVYRITALLSLLAPLTVFSILFILAFFLANDAFTRLMILILLVLHLSGCVGDLYNIWLLLTRFKNPATLRQDTGPKQIYYTKEY